MRAMTAKTGSRRGYVTSADDASLVPHILLIHSTGFLPLGRIYNSFAKSRNTIYAGSSQRREKTAIICNTIIMMVMAVGCSLFGFSCIVFVLFPRVADGVRSSHNEGAEIYANGRAIPPEAALHKKLLSFDDDRLRNSRSLRMLCVWSRDKATGRLTRAASQAETEWWERRGFCLARPSVRQRARPKPTLRMEDGLRGQVAS